MASPFNSGTHSGRDSDCEHVGNSVGPAFKFNPICELYREFACKRVKVPYVEDNSKRRVTDIVDLGPPCKLKTVKPDGNCFFRAISQALCHNEDSHAKIREAIVSFLKSRIDSKRGHIAPEGISSSDYINTKRMDRLGVWATEVKIQALSDMLQLPVYTYYKNRWLRFTSRDVIWEKGIYLNNNGVHYDLVLCVKSKNGCAACRDSYKGDATPDYNDVAAESHRYPTSRPPETDTVLGVQHSTEVKEQTDTRFHFHGSDNHDYDEHLDPKYNKDLRPWTLFNETWYPFIEQLDDCWWGDVCVSSVVTCMLLYGTDGDVAVTAGLSGEPGNVCSVTVRSSFSTVAYHIVLRGCSYVCDAISDESFRSPTTCVCKILATVSNPRIMARPATRKVEHKLNSVSTSTNETVDRKRSPVKFGVPCGTFPCCDITVENVEHQHVSVSTAMDETVDLTRLPIWFDVPCSEFPDCEMTPRTVQRELEKVSRVAGVALYNVTRDVPGYLFDVVTAENILFVTFDRYGYIISDCSDTLRFWSMEDVLCCMCESKGIGFVCADSVFPCNLT